MAGTTHLIVMRYTFRSRQTNDEVAIWVDPGSLGVGEGRSPPLPLHDQHRHTLLFDVRCLSPK